MDIPPPEVGKPVAWSGSNPAARARLDLPSLSRGKGPTRPRGRGGGWPPLRHLPRQPGARDAVREVTAVSRSVLENSRVTSGCAIAAVAVACNTSPRAATGAVFIAWQASIEGAIVMSRAQESLTPFDSVVAQLERLVTTESS